MSSLEKLVSAKAQWQVGFQAFPDYSKLELSVEEQRLLEHGFLVLFQNKIIVNFPRKNFNLLSDFFRLFSDGANYIFLKFFETTFQPLEEISSIPQLPDMSFCLNSTGYFAFFDTEGLDYQTELGEHYDIVTVLPHTLIAENVFLVVRDRLNPNEGSVDQLFNSLI